MNTKTMRLPPRRVLTSNKRKDREGFDTLKPSPPQPPAPPTKLPKPTVLPQLSGSAKLSEPAPVCVSVSVLSNQLLAGYLAHEFLTKGTLFGQRWDPARAEASGGGGGSGSESNVSNNNHRTKASQKGKEAEPSKERENYQRYVEVSGLLKGDGAHLPGIFNPSQLAHFLQM
ncbi:uncharacterized protein LOC125370508 [Ricinus communis]|uniref:uncharacterized protein LOC125370508 n=1 Tax=Ricinus communis TaxID=3988 RepID=UPI00201A2725|nr:uncharacterized protein LOC125370508 [Ricinus communis]